MKAYCINLDRRPDRLEYMTHQFSIQGMTAERIVAVDANLPEVADAAALVQPMLSGQRISVGAYGCFQSHRETWLKIVASGEAHGLVMEDDLFLADGFSAYLKDGWVPSDADIVRLETFLMRTHLDMSVDFPAGSRHLWRLRSMHLGAGCYIISAAAAQRLYDCTAAIRFPVDVVLFCETSELFAELITYQMVPAPAAQEQRLRRKSFDASWLATNIGDKSHSPSRHAESLLGRLGRRMIETLRAWRQRTQYVVVPFG
jgi:glycosyl transferase family 25